MKPLAIALALIVTAVALLGSLTTPTNAVEVERDLSGKYRCEGQSQGGTKYSGEVLIVKLGETYLIDWDLGGEKSEKYKGVGLLTDSVLSVGWQVGTGSAVVAYKMEATGDLTGRWAIRGTKETGTEKLTRVKE